MSIDCPKMLYFWLNVLGGAEGRRALAALEAINSIRHRRAIHYAVGRRVLLAQKHCEAVKLSNSEVEEVARIFRLIDQVPK